MPLHLVRVWFFAVLHNPLAFEHEKKWIWIFFDYTLSLSLVLSPWHYPKKYTANDLNGKKYECMNYSRAKMISQFSLCNLCVYGTWGHTHSAQISTKHKIMGRHELQWLMRIVIWRNSTTIKIKKMLISAMTWVTLAWFQSCIALHWNENVSVLSNNE